MASPRVSRCISSIFRRSSAGPGCISKISSCVPQQRSHGIGRALLRALARIAEQRDCGRMEWAVLDWNEPALRFYKSLDARQMNEWIIHRLTPVEIARLAAET